jgi:hypothetical protein
MTAVTPITRCERPAVRIGSSAMSGKWLNAQQFTGTARAGKRGALTPRMIAERPLRHSGRAMPGALT